MYAENKIAHWVASLDLAQISAPALAVAETCLFDGIGVAIAGRATDVFGRCSALVRSPHDVSSAAFMTGVAIHALDYDDTCYAGIVHGTAAVLPAVLAVCEHLDGDGQLLLESFVAGVEALYAIGDAVTDSFYTSGHWSTTALGILGATCGAAKAFGLDAAQTAHALRLAANMPLGLRASHGSNAKPYLNGVAARLGVEAALAARAGIEGSPGTLEGRFGFAAVQNAGIWHDERLGRLGQTWGLIDPGIAIKRHPLCSAAQAAIEATIALRAAHAITPEDVVSVDCRATALVVNCLTYPTPETIAQAQFSMSFAIACAIAFGDVGLAHLRVDVLRSAAVAQLITRVGLREDRALVPPEQLTQAPEGAAVTMTLSDGRVVTHTVLAAAGMPSRPLTREHLTAKFFDCAQFGGVDTQRATVLAQQLQNVARIAHVRQLTQLASSEIRAA